MDKNLIEIELYDNGADGANVKVNGEDAYFIEEGYEIKETLEEIFKRLDITKPIEIVEREIYEEEG